ncbi:MAG: TonB-dependent receptor [Caulobacteraceae bacterium]
MGVFVNRVILQRHVAAIALLSGLTISGVARAQTDPPSGAAPIQTDAPEGGGQAQANAQPADSTVQEVTVTARHRTENLQDVPESVQAISGKTLELKNTVTLSDITAQTPGLFDQVGNPRNTSLAIRGLGVTSSAGDGLDNMVGVYFDGVYQGRPGMALQDLIDIDSFEVLRGPQGTLFGRNSEVGALNITTEKPSFIPSEKFEVSFGNDSFTQAKAILTGPINDKVAFRTVLFGTYSDGWLPNSQATKFSAVAAQEGISAPTATASEDRLNSQERYGVRQKFLINASDRLTLSIAGDVERENDSNLAGSTEITQLYGPGNWGPNTTLAQQSKVTGALSAMANLRSFGGVQNYVPTVNPGSDIGNSLEAMRTTQGGVALTTDYKLDWATLTSISAWRFWQFNPPQDSDGTPLDIYYNAAISRQQQWSEELRLTSREGGPIEWQAGVYFFNQDLKDHYIVHQFGADVIPLYNALLHYGAVSGSPVSNALIPQLTGSQVIENTHVQDQNEAVYGQATWHITDKLSLTGGARFTHDKKSGGSPVDLSQLPAAVRGAAVTAGAASSLANYGVNGSTSGYPLSAWVSDNNVSGSASLSYKITPATMVYLAFSNGYQAAALNLNAVVKSGIPAVVNPSTTDNYELGIKTSLLDHHLTFNADVYNEVLYGYQTTYTQILANGSTLRYIANAGNVRSRGVEWDVTAALGEGVLLSFDGAYNDAIFQSAHSVAPPPEVTTASFDATGRAAPDAPKVTLSLTPSWNHRVGDRETFYTYAQYSYSSSFYSATNLSAYSIVPDQFNLNLRAGLQLDDGKYDISLYANNATNQRNIYAKGLLAVPTTSIYFAQSQSLAPPAMYGITLRAKY